MVSPDEADRLFRLSFLRGWVATQQAAGKESTIWPLLHRNGDLTTLIDTAAGDAAPNTAAAFVGPDGPWRLSTMDVRDAAQGVLLALTQPGAVGRSFNLASAEPTSYIDGAAAISEIFDVPTLTIEMPMTWRLEISIEAARQHLGYQPEHDYRSTLGAREGDQFIPAAEGDAGVYAKLSGR